MFKLMKKFFDFCNKTNRRKFYVSSFLGFLQAIFEGFKIPAIYVALKAVLEGNADGKTALTVLGIMLVSFAGSAACKNNSTMLQTDGGYSTCAQKRIEISEHLRYMPMGFFNSRSLGNITSVTTNTMQGLENIAARTVMLITSALMTTLVTTVIMYIFDWRIGLVLTAGLVLFFAANNLLLNSETKCAAKKDAADQTLIEQLLEYIQGITEVKTFGLTGKKCSALNNAIQESTGANIKMELHLIPLMGLQNFLLKLTGVAMTAAAIYFHISGTMSLVTCLVMIIASFIIYAAIEGASSYSALLHSIGICVDKANAILDTPTMNLNEDKEGEVSPTLQSPRCAAVFSATPSAGSDAARNACSGIMLCNISFSYGTRKIINGVSAEIKPHTTTAIVGPSGSGKSTLTSLISRFWDVDSGSVLFNGKDVRTYNYDELMKNFSFVFQNVYLFKDTIANNIRFGSPYAPMEKVIEAAKKACCHEFIMKLPKGYDTVIGEEGVNLSGGERQRLSIARAIMKDSPVIVLDEATANVDPENEADLMQAISSLTKEKTIIMIAHRLKTVEHADQILVLENGRITQRGTHQELLSQDGLYKRFVEGRKKAVSWRL